MTSKQDILALADRLEKADGPDRELDVQIALAVGLYPIDALRCRGGVIINDKPRHAPVYTASLDAAMTLVPENHAVDLTMWGAMWGGKHRARVLPLHKDGERWLHHGSDPHFCVNASTPALALTSASLRAIAEAGG